ncbi:hypothetical protein ACFC14_02270 [Microbacterium sp. NPDC055988]|uniref:hypothetical protein n=1 Tax=Microbacterium sp. NPDC055988 TaxID=3345671 RepID=UPI0035DD2459
MNTRRLRYRPPLRKESFRITELERARDDEQLQEYLASANIRITGLVGGGTLAASLAHYAHTSLAFVTTPPVSITWNRDEASRSRALLLFARTGGLEVTTAVPVVRRGTGAVVVPPGDVPLEISVSQPENELIYVSVDAQVLPAVVSELTHGVPAPPIPWRTLVPLYAFVRGLCTTPEPSKDEPDLLAAAVGSVVDALARTALAGLEPSAGIVARALVVIDEQFRDPRVDLTSIAGQLQVGVRTLQAAFAAEGSTVTGELRRVRTDSVVRLMVSHPHLTQEQRAHLSGFGSLSALYRALHSLRMAPE